jgi:radical SAM protein with 4Fe4S-binding SPASM domain
MSLNEIKIEITDKCLLKCKHCSTDAKTHNKSFHSIKIIEKIANQAIDLKCKNIFVSGGEPFLHPCIDEIIKLLTSLDVNTRIYTSGIISSKPTLGIPKEILQNLKYCGLNHLVFSLYSSNPSVHDKITNLTNSHSETTKTIRNSIGLGIKTEIHFVALRELINELPALVEYLMELGISKLSILRFVPQGRGQMGKSNLEPSRTDYIRLRNIINEVRSKNSDMNIRLGSPFNFLCVRPLVPCTTGKDRMIIDPAGFAYPCDALKRIKIDDIASSIYSHSISEIVENNSLFKLVNQTRIPEQCKNCDKLNDCMGGCLAQRMLNGTDFLKPDPHCIYHD